MMDLKIIVMKKEWRNEWKQSLIGICDDSVCVCLCVCVCLDIPIEQKEKWNKVKRSNDYTRTLDLLWVLYLVFIFFSFSLLEERDIEVNMFKNNSFNCSGVCVCVEIGLHLVSERLESHLLAIKKLIYVCGGVNNWPTFIDHNFAIKALHGYMIHKLTHTHTHTNTI